MSKEEHIKRDVLQERISQLSNRLESDVSRLRSQHLENLATLTSDFNRLMEELTHVFTHRLDDIHEQYRQNLEEVHDELGYLRELLESQRLMMAANVEYIKQLEERSQSTPEVRVEK